VTHSLLQHRLELFEIWSRRRRGGAYEDLLDGWQRRHRVFQKEAELLKQRKMFKKVELVKIITLLIYAFGVSVVLLQLRK